MQPDEAQNMRQKQQILASLPILAAAAGGLPVTGKPGRWTGSMRFAGTTLHSLESAPDERIVTSGAVFVAPRRAFL
jgi:hypothetical protein